MCSEVASVDVVARVEWRTPQTPVVAPPWSGGAAQMKRERRQRLGTLQIRFRIHFKRRRFKKMAECGPQ